MNESTSILIERRPSRTERRALRHRNVIRSLVSDKAITPVTADQRALSDEAVKIEARLTPTMRMNLRTIAASGNSTRSATKVALLNRGLISTEPHTVTDLGREVLSLMGD